MRHLLTILRGYLPHRRRRMWRYVSAGRRRAGWVVFLALAVLIYGYWYMTNDQRIARLATAYLEDLTGAEVRIRHAEFHLFGPIELEGVSVRVPEPQWHATDPTRRPAAVATSQPDRKRRPLLKAGRVVLHHRALSLLRLKVQPTRIVFDQPEVTIERYTADDGLTPAYDYSFEYFLKRMKRRRTHRPPAALPSIRIDNCLLTSIDVIGRAHIVRKDSTLNIYLTPDSQRDYRIRIEPVRTKKEISAAQQAYNRARQVVQDAGTPPRRIREFLDRTYRQREYLITILARDDPAQAERFAEMDRAHRATQRGYVEVLLNVSTGQATPLGGMAGIPTLAGLMPLKFRQWQQSLGLIGRLRIPDQDQPMPGGVLELELDDVALRLPDKHGGLSLHHVRGRVRLDGKGVTLTNVRGRIAEAGDARFTIINGRYDGFTLDSPFTAEVTVTGLAVPESLPEASSLAYRVRRLHYWYSPVGTLDLSARLHRGPDGKMTVSGTAAPNGMTMTHRSFPYTVRNLRGTIRFDLKRADLNLTCSRDGGGASLTGWTELAKGSSRYTIRIAADDVLCHPPLAAALPPGYKAAWKVMKPEGRFNAVVRVVRRGPGTKSSVEVDVPANGRTSLTYQPFPYRVTLAAGQMLIRRGAIKLDDLLATHGPMACRINGDISTVGKKEAFVDVDIRTLTGKGMVIDDDLIRAMGSAGPTVAALHPAGVVDAEIEVDQPKGGKITYHVAADVRDGRLKPDVFPYEITNIDAHLDITPSRITISRFAGRHGGGNVRLVPPSADDRDPKRPPGLIYLDTKPMGVFLRVGTDVLPVDDELYAALPASAQSIWDQFQPRGAGSVRGYIWSNVAGHPPGLDYDLNVTAAGVDAVYEKFPHRLKNMTGTMLLRPRRIDLQNFVTHPPPPAGGARLGRSDLGGDARQSSTINGHVVFDKRKTDVKLRLVSQGVPLTDALLKALPVGAAAITDRLQPGGTCDLNLRPRDEKDRPLHGLEITIHDAVAATASEAAQPQRITWQLNGSLKFHDAVLALGDQLQTFSGSIDGVIAHNGEDTRIESDLTADRIRVDDRSIRNLEGQLLKSFDGSMFSLRHFSAEVHGGRVAGKAELHLGKPLRYGLDLKVTDLQLAKLVRRGDPAKKTDIAGLLTGDISLSGALGDADTARATGVMRISKGRLARLPVLLGVLQVITLGLPGDAAFTEGDLSYSLVGRELTFNEIYLSGPTLTIVGSGTTDIKTGDLDLRFLSTSQRKLPHLKGLEEFLRTPFRELMEIHIDGKIENPRIRTVALSNLDRFLKELLGPGSGKKP